MRTGLAAVFVAWMFGFAGGCAQRVLPSQLRDPLGLTLATAGFSLGAITLLAFWAMLAAPGGAAFSVAFGASVALVLADLAIGFRARSTSGPGERSRRSEWIADPLSRALIGALVACSAGIVFNATYWPFERGDALDLYAPFGKHLYETSTLPIGDRLYEAYPMLIPTAYAFTHWAAGSVNEYVARLVPALMALGAAGTAGALATAMGSGRTGILASALVVLTPVFGRWASTGYTDVPAAFYLGLTVLFAWHWWISGDRRPLVLSGLSAGLAIWTKNSTLTLVPSLIWLVMSRSFADGSASTSARVSVWTSAATVLGSVVAVAGPWYVRNLAAFGFAVPPTIWTDRARHDLSTLAITLRGDQYFGAPGWVFVAGLLYGAAGFFWLKNDNRQKWHVLMTFAVPFLGAWWWLASYESRFLMTILPVLAVMGALTLEDAATAITATWSRASVRRATIFAVAATIVATGISLRKTVEHKEVLVRHAWLDDADRHRVRLGGLFDLGVSIGRLPAGSRLGGVPRSIRYYLDERRFASIDSMLVTAPPDALSDRYDYVVYQTVEGQRIEWPEATPILRTSDGYALFDTHR